MTEPVPKLSHRPEEGWLYPWLYDHGITPNKISAARLALIPFVVGLIAWPKFANADISTTVWMLIAAAVLFLLAAVTDRLDGELARRSDQITALGKFLDPLVDKGLVIITLVALAWFYHPGNIGWWTGVGLIAWFEIVSTLLRSWIKWRRPDVDLSAQWWGKAKLAIQIFLVTILILFFFEDQHLVVILEITVITVISDFATILRLWKEYRS